MADAKRTHDLSSLRQLLVDFAAERDWGQFHTPKNLATALSVEAAELLEPFQWLVAGDASELDDQKRMEIRHEMADVFAYLILLADRLDVDLGDALVEKVALNAIKYPVELVRGESKKYSDYKN
ncbi:MAG TPA: nucleotide pyrophosphohydrolase [Herbaspirillum sp.]|jgi:NTP pyrophosphatase (non-canonical NTP hydrolase)